MRVVASATVLLTLLIASGSPDAKNVSAAGGSTPTPCSNVYTQAEHAVFNRSDLTRASLKRVERMRRCQGSPKASMNAKRLTRRLRGRYRERKIVQSGGNRGIGRLLAAKRGWTGSQWSCLEALWSRESGWDHLVSNHGGSGAYGIPQALPGAKMASAGSDWATNPATQIKWGLGYIAGRFGTPCAANAHQASAGWY
jgi:hypothetical protein